MNLEQSAQPRRPLHERVLRCAWPNCTNAYAFVTRSPNPIAPANWLLLREGRALCPEHRIPNNTEED